jgi:hypothetical protein
MARPLIIDDLVRTMIKAALARALENPIPFEALREHASLAATRDLKLADRKPGLIRPPLMHVAIPIGFRAAISVEEQPAGMVRHLSVSADRPGRIPHPTAVVMIAEEFGMLPPFDALWLEEFDPGHQAVNVLKLIEPRAEGTA